MNRRDFIKRLLASGLVVVSDPERLIWQPGERIHFFISKPAQAGKLSAAAIWISCCNLGNGNETLSPEGAAIV